MVNMKEATVAEKKSEKNWENLRFSVFTLFHTWTVNGFDRIEDENSKISFLFYTQISLKLKRFQQGSLNFSLPFSSLSVSSQIISVAVRRVVLAINVVFAWHSTHFSKQYGFVNYALELLVLKNFGLEIWEKIKWVIKENDLLSYKNNHRVLSKASNELSIGSEREMMMKPFKIELSCSIFPEEV